MPQLLATRVDNNSPIHIQLNDDIHLDSGDVTIAVSHSAINYKDALALCNRAPIFRTFPIVPGIDLAGTISASTSPHWRVGQDVVIAGRGLGERRSGGYSTVSRQPADILTARPATLSAFDAMAIGTAGMTAALCVQAIQARVAPTHTLPVLVTGASGGVGMHAISMLKQLGYTVVAATGRLALTDQLTQLGADQVIDRTTIAGDRPLERELWSAVIDTVGGDIASAAIRSTAYAGVVAMCGNAGGTHLNINVFPLILRGIQIAGIDSVSAPQAVVDAAWEFAATHYDATRLQHMLTTVPLTNTIAAAHELLASQRQGRCVVSLT